MATKVCEVFYIPLDYTCNNSILKTCKAVLEKGGGGVAEGGVQFFKLWGEGLIPLPLSKINIIKGTIKQVFNRK
jgi:hypothetical protein